MVPLFVTADELRMLHDRVSTGVEMSEEKGWGELLTKVERAQVAVAHQTEPRNVKYQHHDHERRYAVDRVCAQFWPPGYHSYREVTDAILGYVDTVCGGDTRPVEKGLASIAAIAAEAESVLAAARGGR